MAPDVAADAAAARPGEPGTGPAAPASSSTAQDTAPMPRPLPERPAVRRPDDVGSEPDGEPGAPRRSVMDRLARRIVAGQRSPLVRPVLEPLASLHRQSHAKADLTLLQRAYDVAEAAHAGQKRKSGDPYITHPLAVATILAGLGMDTTTLVAALLHDTVEDTGATLEAITAEFGSEVAHLVDGVTKIDRVKLGDAAQAETIRKMIVAMARDPRVLVIKLADRLHNMRTLRFLPAREAGDQGARDAGDPRAAGPPPGHEHDQVGARGPRVRHAVPEAVRRDRAAGRRAGAVAGHLPGRSHLGGHRAAQGREDRGRRHRPAQALLLDLPEDDRPRPRLHRHLGPRRHPRAGRLGARLLRGARHHARPLAAGAGALQGLRRDAEVQHVPVAAHDGDRAARQARGAADPHARHAPHRRLRHRRALEVQGEGAGRRQAQRRRVRRPGQARHARRHAVAAPAPRLAARGAGARRVPRDAALRPRSRRRSSSSRPRATSSACPASRRRSTSPTRCTPRSATTAPAPA